MVVYDEVMFKMSNIVCLKKQLKGDIIVCLMVLELIKVEDVMWEWMYNFWYEFDVMKMLELKVKVYVAKEFQCIEVVKVLMLKSIVEVEVY